jgi:hypothetical protein
MRPGRATAIACAIVLALGAAGFGRPSDAGNASARTATSYAATAVPNDDRVRDRPGTVALGGVLSRAR